MWREEGGIPLVQTVCWASSLYLERWVISLNTDGTDFVRGWATKSLCSLGNFISHGLTSPDTYTQEQAWIHKVDSCEI